MLCCYPHHGQDECNRGGRLFFALGKPERAIGNRGLAYHVTPCPTWLLRARRVAAATSLARLGSPIIVCALMELQRGWSRSASLHRHQQRSPRGGPLGAFPRPSRPPLPSRAAQHGRAACSRKRARGCRCRATPRALPCTPRATRLQSTWRGAVHYSSTVSGGHGVAPHHQRGALRAFNCAANAASDEAAGAGACGRVQGGRRGRGGLCARKHEDIPRTAARTNLSALTSRPAQRAHDWVVKQKR
jgi:hypothetical protein